MGDISALNLKDIWILDTYNVPAGEGLDNFNNVFPQVPGPRRLRRSRGG